MIENITTKRKKKRGGECLTEAEERAALERLVRPDARALFQFLVATGLRISEALIVELGDIERGFTRLVGKGGKERTVYYSAELVRMLRPYIGERERAVGGDDRGRLFAFNRQTAHRLLSAADVYPHLLRHTYLTRLYKQTKDLRLTQKVAGHADIRTTSRYTHHTEEEVRRAMTRPRTFAEKIRRAVLSVFGL